MGWQVAIDDLVEYLARCEPAPFEQQIDLLCEKLIRLAVPQNELIDLNDYVFDVPDVPLVIVEPGKSCGVADGE